MTASTNAVRSGESKYNGNAWILIFEKRRDVERYQKLAASGAVTIREPEETQIILRNIESRISELKYQLVNTTIAAPVTGIIDKDFFKEGTFLTIGSQVAALVDDRSLKMELNVTEKEMLRLRKGDKAIITNDVYSEKTFVGVVSVIAPKGNDLYSYSVELALDNTKDLKPGMYATATFGTDKSNKKSFILRWKAIVGGIKDPYVLVVRDNKAYKISVQIGQVNSNFTEIVKGVSNDDMLVITGQINLKNGSEVSVIE
jgi:RND family efflux transporter MFP subunit